MLFKSIVFELISYLCNTTTVMYRILLLLIWSGSAPALNFKKKIIFLILSRYTYPTNSPLQVTALLVRSRHRRGEYISLGGLPNFRCPALVSKSSKHEILFSHLNSPFNGGAYSVYGAYAPTSCLNAKLTIRSRFSPCIMIKSIQPQSNSPLL